MSTVRRCILIPALLCVATLGACSLPTPAAHEVLQISARGDYLLQGRALSRAELAHALAAERQRVSTLMVEVSASPEAGIDAVTFGVEAIRSAHARIAFIHEAERS